MLSNTCLTPCIQFIYLLCAGKDLLDFLSITLNERETCRKEERLALSCVARGWFSLERLTTLYHFSC